MVPIPVCASHTTYSPPANRNWRAFMSDHIDSVEQVTLRFSGAKLARLFASLAVLIALSMAIKPDSWRSLELWECLVFGGIAAGIVIASVVLPHRHYLRLTPAGLTIQYIGRSRHYTWNEMRNFRVIGVNMEPCMPIGQEIVFDLSADSPNRRTTARMAGSVLGHDVSILVMFGISAYDLVVMLNEWQARYGTDVESRPANSR
jgi:hypothetical protein